MKIFRLLLYIFLIQTVLIYCTSSNKYSKIDSTASPPGKDNETTVEENNAKIETSKELFSKTIDDEMLIQPFYSMFVGIRGGMIFFTSSFKDLMETSPIASLFVDYNPRFFNNLLLELNISYINTNVKTIVDNRYTLIPFSLGIKYELPVYKSISTSILVGGGGYYSNLTSNRTDLSEVSYFGGYAKALFSIDYTLNYNYNISIGGSYNYFTEKSGKSINGFGAFLQLGYKFGANPSSILEKRIKRSVELDPILPAEANYYSISGFGKLKINNKLKSSIEDVRVSVFISDYMDNPSFSDVYSSIQPDSTVKIPLKASFNNNLFNVTSKNSVSVRIKMEYKIPNYPETLEITENKDVSIFNRNAISWNETKKIGAFITPIDPPIYKFSHDIVKWMENTWTDSKIYIPNKNIKKAMAIWSGLNAYGLQYNSDPQGFKANFEIKTSVDYVQYPREFLQSKSGDCDDFTALYCSLLESVGVKTAIVTVPGHILMAFDTGLLYSELNTDIIDREMVIVHASYKSVWIPIEITTLGTRKSFFYAWKKGIETFLRLGPADTTEFIPVSECHELYQPVSLGNLQKQISFNKSTKTKSNFISYTKEYRKWLFNNIDEMLKDESKYVKNITKGIVYSKYKKYSKAGKYFLKASKLTKKSEKMYDALVNLGLLYFERNKYNDAVKQFKKILKKKPDYSNALYGLALTYDAQNNKSARDKIVSQLPEHLEKLFRSKVTVGDTSRASDEAKHNIIWFGLN